MAEETIYCPSCNKKLRVPEEMLGQPVQCPLCRIAFVAPVRGPSATAEPPSVLPVAPRPRPAEYPPPVPERLAPESSPEEEAERERAVAVVRGPATALLLLGLMGWLANAYSGLTVRSEGIEGIMRQHEKQREMMPGLFAGQEGNISPELLYYGTLTLGFLFLLLCTGIIVGATAMLRLRLYWLAILGSLLAMANISNCCCLIGVPVGLWSLSVLMRPEVRRAFE